MCRIERGASALGERAMTLGDAAVTAEVDGGDVPARAAAPPDNLRVASAMPTNRLTCGLLSSGTNGDPLRCGVESPGLARGEPGLRAGRRLREPVSSNRG